MIRNIFTRKIFCRLTIKNSEKTRPQKTELFSDKNEILNTNRETFSSSNCSTTIKPVVIVPPTKRVKKTEYFPHHKTTATIIKPFSDEVKQIKKLEKVPQPFVINNVTEPYIRQGMFHKPLGETFVSKRKVAQVEPFKIFDDEPLDLSMNKKKSVIETNVTPVTTSSNEITDRLGIGKLITLDL